MYCTANPALPIAPAASAIGCKNLLTAIGKLLSAMSTVLNPISLPSESIINVSAVVDAKSTVVAVKVPVTVKLSSTVTVPPAESIVRFPELVLNSATSILPAVALPDVSLTASLGDLIV